MPLRFVHCANHRLHAHERGANVYPRSMGGGKGKEKGSVVLVQPSRPREAQARLLLPDECASLALADQSEANALKVCPFALPVHEYSASGQPFSTPGRPRKDSSPEPIPCPLVPCRQQWSHHIYRWRLYGLRANGLRFTSGALGATLSGMAHSRLPGARAEADPDALVCAVRASCRCTSSSLPIMHLAWYSLAR